jgi:hypothetical protein
MLCGNEIVLCASVKNPITCFSVIPRAFSSHKSSAPIMCLSLEEVPSTRSKPLNGSRSCWATAHTGPTASTAISAFRTTPPPAVLAPGPLQFQGVAGATVPPRPRLSGYVLGAEMSYVVFSAGLQAPEVHQAPISVTAGGSSLSQLPAPHQKHVSLRRSCGALPPAALRGGCVIPQTPAVLWARLSPHPPPHPLQFYAHCLPCGGDGSKFAGKGGGGGGGGFLFNRAPAHGDFPQLRPPYPGNPTSVPQNK